MFAGAARTGTSSLLIILLLLACIPAELLHSHDGCKDGRSVVAAGASSTHSTYDEVCDLCGHKILLKRNVPVDHPLVVTLVFPIYDDIDDSRVHVDPIALPAERGPPAIV